MGVALVPMSLSRCPFGRGDRLSFEVLEAVWIVSGVFACTKKRAWRPLMARVQRVCCWVC